MKAKQVREKLGISNYELSKLREHNLIEYSKINSKTYQYNINEELIKPFFKDGKLSKSLSTNSPEEYIETNLTGNELDLPSINEYGYSTLSYNKEQKRQSKWQERDNFIKLYRKHSLKPKVSSSIDEIVNDMAYPFDDGSMVKIDFVDNSDIKEATTKAIQESFSKILKLLNFNNTADDLIRDWYIDGGLPLEVIYDNKKPKEGIKSILKLTPFGLKEIQDREHNTYYTYDTNLIANTYNPKDVKKFYSPEQFVYIGSGLWDEEKIYQTSYLRVALKAINDLSYIENSIIKYRITRASEKNIWNVDVGSMSSSKAKNHISAVSREVSSNLKYNTETGDINVDAVEGITSDWIFPSRNGKQKTSVETINGNSDFISKLDDLEYFRKELYESLKIPIGRLDADSTMDYTADDILREELKFTRHIEKLKRSFSELFKELLRRDLISTQQLSEDEFNEIINDIIFKWNYSNVIVEKAKINNIKFKSESVQEIKDSGVVGTIISNDYLLTKIMGMNQEDIEEEQKKIEEEKKQGLHQEVD